MLAAGLERAYEHDWYNKLWARWFGIGFVAMVWITYMAALYIWLSYGDNTTRRMFIVIMFCACLAALSAVLWGVGLPFTFPYTDVM